MASAGIFAMEKRVGLFVGSVYRDACKDMTRSFVQIDQAIDQASGQYFRLVLLVGQPGSGKTSSMQTLSEMRDYPLINVNLELSKRMLDLTRNQRSREVERLLKEVIGAAPGEVVLLDNPEILFAPDLELEPLRLLQAISRNRTIVASWNGTFLDGTLSYAVPGHPEFIQLRQVEAIVLSVGVNPNN